MRARTIHACLAFLVGAASAAGSALAAKVGGWDVNPMRSNTGQFSGCLMKATYDRGTTIAVMMTPKAEWALVFGHPRWKLSDGQVITLTVNVDGSIIARGRGSVYGRDLIIMPLKGAAAYASLQAGHGMRISTSLGEMGSFKLTGTRAAMDAVLECVNANTQPGARPPATSSAPPPATAGRQVPVPASEAMVMLNNLFAQAGVVGYRFETPRSNTITWSLPSGVRGSFFAFRNWTAPIEQALTAVSEAATKDCKGDLATFQKAVPTSDGTVVRKVDVACKSGESTSHLTWTIVRRLDGLLVCFAQSGGGREGGGPGAPAAPADDRLMQGVQRL